MKREKYLVLCGGSWSICEAGTAPEVDDEGHAIPGHSQAVWADETTGQVICPIGHEDALVPLRQFVPMVAPPPHGADRIADLISANNRMEAEARAGRSLARTIVAFLGNVDHSRGGGENAARVYGGMLESIREMCGEFLSSRSNPETVSPGNLISVPSNGPAVRTGGNDGSGS